MGIHLEFDRDGWDDPQGTVIKVFECDLRDLWNTHPQQAARFVAQALLDEAPRFFFNLGETIEVGVWLWEVDGHQISVKDDLADELGFAFESEGPFGEECLIGLKKLRDKVNELIKKVESAE